MWLFHLMFVTSQQIDIKTSIKETTLIIINGWNAFLYGFFKIKSDMWQETDAKTHTEIWIISNYKKRDENHSSRSLFFVDDSFKCIMTHFDAFFCFVEQPHCLDISFIV